MRIKKANRFIYFILRALFKPFLYLRYGLRFDRRISKKVRPPCVIIANHSTFSDQFIVGVGFRLPINFVASDSLFRNGIGSSLMKLIARPIPISKGATDPTAVKNMLSIVKSGGSVALFPEGNRTFFGETGSVNPAIAKLIKKMNVPLVIVNISGGFNTTPRWRKNVSKGRMDAHVRRIVGSEELADLTVDEVFQVIKDGLYFNEFEYNAEKKVSFKGGKKAEYLESALFYCPSCGKLESLKSKKNDFFCSACGARVRIDRYGFFERIENADKLPDTIYEWSKLQESAVKTHMMPTDENTALFSDSVKFYRYERAKKNETLGDGEIRLFNNRLCVCDMNINIADIAEMSIHSIAQLQIYLHNGEKYLVKSISNGTNLLKYMVFFYKIKAIIENREEFSFGY